MLLSRYEVHQFPNPLVPFIFHPHYHLDMQEIETNWHQNIEILLCFQGNGYVRCGADFYDFAKDDIVVVNSDQLHTVGSADSLSYCCFIIGADFCMENGINTNSLSFHNVIRDSSLVAQIHNIFRLQQQLDVNAPYAVADCRYAALGLLRQLCIQYSHTKISPDYSSTYVKKAITYIRENYTHPLLVDDVANHIGISKYHLCREFKALTGKTIIGFINLLRCSEAKRLIEKGMNVSSAALLCGFDNLSYFSKTFQKTIGILPSSIAKRSGL